MTPFMSVQLDDTERRSLSLLLEKRMNVLTYGFMQIAFPMAMTEKFLGKLLQNITFAPHEVR